MILRNAWPRSLTLFEFFTMKATVLVTSFNNIRREGNQNRSSDSCVNHFKMFEEWSNVARTSAQYPMSRHIQFLSAQEVLVTVMYSEGHIQANVHI